MLSTKSHRQREPRAGAYAARSILQSIFSLAAPEASPTSSSSYSESDSDGNSTSSDGGRSSSADPPVAHVTPPPANPQSALTTKLGRGISLVKNCPTSVTPGKVFQAPAATKTRQPRTAATQAAATASDTDARTQAMLESPIAYWLKHQATHLVPGIAVKVVVSEVIEVDDTLVESTSTRIYFNGPDAKVQQTRNPTWRSTATLLTRKKIAHTGGVTSGAQSHFSVAVRCFSHPVFITLAPDGQKKQGKIPAITAPIFPPLDDSINNIKSIEILSQEASGEYFSNVEVLDYHETAHDIAASMNHVIGANMSVADSRAAADSVNKDSIWTQRERNDSDVDEVLKNMGSHSFKTIRVLDPEYHEAFRRLCRSAGVYKLDAPLEERAAILARILAIPLLHLRVLPGSHSSKKREFYTRAQLTGLVCNPTAATIAAAPPPQDKSLTSELQEMQRSMKRSQQVIALVAAERVGAANKIMKRSDAPPKPIDEAFADLLKLHPDGAPPANLKVLKLFGPDTVSIAAVRNIVKAGCKETAPGPDQWTQELLHVALQDAAFSESFRNIVIDICNGALPYDIDSLLSISNIIGIPKDKGGTRPISMGVTFLKVAVSVAVAREAKTLAIIFRGTQYGVNTPSGIEMIIHAVRQFMRTGVRPSRAGPGVVIGTAAFAVPALAGSQRVIWTLDCSNAFNTPTRQAMWNGLENYKVRGLAGVFKTAYAQHSKMHVLGSNGKYTIDSRCGARQGTVDGSVNFCLVLQPALDEIRNNHAGTNVMAYLDDITGLSVDVPSALKAVSSIVEHLTSQGMSLNFSKCELCMPGLVGNNYAKQVTAALNNASVPADSCLRMFSVASCIKLLGASIATTNEAEGEHLNARAMAAYDAQMSRLAELPASPQAMVLLRQCVVPSLSFVTRVHHPDVTLELCKTTDAKNEHLVQSWSQGQMVGLRQQSIMHTACKQGGLGIISHTLTAPAAYAASMMTVAAAEAGKKPDITQRHIVQATQLELAKAVAQADPQVALHLERMAHGGNVLTTNGSQRVGQDTYAAYLRIALLSPSEKAASSAHARYACPGCQNSAIGRGANNLYGALSSSAETTGLREKNEWMCHAIGCAAIPGGAVTKRHDSIRDRLFHLARLAGYTNVEKEPRNLRIYNCPCGLKGLSHDTYCAHSNACSKAVERPRTQGPDLIFTDLQGNSVAIDVRVPNETSQQHSGKPIQEVFAAADAEKQKKYGEVCAKVGATLVTFAVSACGAVGIGAKSLLKKIAHDSGSDETKLRQAVACLAASGSAYALLTAETLAGIRPQSRFLSQAQLKLLGKQLDVPLGAPKPVGPRLVGVAPPSEDQMTALLNNLQQLAANVNTLVATTITRAKELKRDEEEEVRRESAASNPLVNCVPQHVVPRVPDAEAARPTPAAASRSRDLIPLPDYAANARELRMSRAVNAEEELFNQTVDAMASAERHATEMDKEIDAIKRKSDTIVGRTAAIWARTNETAATEEQAVTRIRAMTEKNNEKNGQLVKQVEDNKQRLSHLQHAHEHHNVYLGMIQEARNGAREVGRKSAAALAEAEHRLHESEAQVVNTTMELRHSVQHQKDWQQQQRNDENEVFAPIPASSFRPSYKSSDVIAAEQQQQDFISPPPRNNNSRRLSTVLQASSPPWLGQQEPSPTQMASNEMYMNAYNRRSTQQQNSTSSSRLSNLHVNNNNTNTTTTTNNNNNNNINSPAQRRTVLLSKNNNNNNTPPGRKATLLDSNNNNKHGGNARH